MCVGEEIVSGAQRIHDVTLLTERAEHWKVTTYTSICILHIYTAHTDICPTSSGHAHAHLHVHMHVHEHMYSRPTYTSPMTSVSTAWLDQRTLSNDSFLSCHCSSSSLTISLQPSRTSFFTPPIIYCLSALCLSLKHLNSFFLPFVLFFLTLFSLFLPLPCYISRYLWLQFKVTSTRSSTVLSLMQEAA